MSYTGGRFSNMTSQEFVDTVYKDLVNFMNNAQVAAGKGNPIAVAMYYGAASAAWEGLNEAINQRGVIPKAWQVDEKTKEM